MRQAVDYRTMCDSPVRGEFAVHITNVSPAGLSISGGGTLDPGERIVVRLPVIGRIEAHRVWSAAGRAGLQFERVLRFDDFDAMVAALQGG